MCRTVSTDAMCVLLGEMLWDLFAVNVGVEHKIKRGSTLDEFDLIFVDGDNLDPRERINGIINKLETKWQNRWINVFVYSGHWLCPNNERSPLDSV